MEIRFSLEMAYFKFEVDQQLNGSQNESTDRMDGRDSVSSGTSDDQSNSNANQSLAVTERNRDVVTKCHLCGLVTFSGSPLQKHMETHTGRKASSNI